MKDFLDVKYDSEECAKQLDEFRLLLDPANREISEGKELMPFFRERHQLMLILGQIAPDVGMADKIAYEFSIGGSFYADIVVANSQTNGFAFFELEDARKNSVFQKQGKKATTEWGRRFEHGFSQIVDWFRFMDCHRGTPMVRDTFGDREIKYSGFLIIGRDAFLANSERDRLVWRSEKVKVDSRYVNCLTFDGLYQQLSQRMSYYFEATKVT